MSSEVLIAMIAAGPPTLAAVLSYVASSRSLRRTVGEPQGVPLTRVLERLETKLDHVEDRLDHLIDEQGSTHERLALLEAQGRGRPWGMLR
jgi:hypothetical protein